MTESFNTEGQGLRLLFRRLHSLLDFSKDDEVVVWPIEQVEMEGSKKAIPILLSRAKGV